MKNRTTILAIETSCDDTGISIVKAGSGKSPVFNVLANIVSSQIEVHKKWGGVYPMLAKREHQKNLVPVLEKALKESKLLNKKTEEYAASQEFKNILERENELYKALKTFLAKYKKPEIDAIAVTTGPGLEPCLWVGVNFAKALSYTWNIPVITANHVKAHLFVNALKKDSLEELKRTDFPAVCLIVSGGHTQLFLMENFGKYRILGETRDDAAGECFDKVAKILKLGYPGGPIISKLAGRKESSIKLPRPMMNTKDYDFSFSGLKTAVLYNFKNQPEKIRKSKKYITEMCTEAQQAIIDVLLKKTIRAAKDFKVKTIILGGGVVANDELRKRFKEKVSAMIPRPSLLIPNKDLCTDNALMVAVAGYFRFKQGQTENWRDIEAKANLRIE